MLRSPTRYTLGSMVAHFQKLFDVTSLSGVYPRMNEVYTRLGEMTNTMRNLREVLELGDLHLNFICFLVSFEYLYSSWYKRLKMLMLMFVSDSRVPSAEVLNQVTRLVSSNEHTAGFHNMLGDADIDRFTCTEITHIVWMAAAKGHFYCRATVTQSVFCFVFSLFCFCFQCHRQSEAA